MQFRLLKKTFTILCVFGFSGLSLNAYADRNAGDVTVNLFVPYSLEETFDFEGGASVTTSDDAGFGVGMGFFYTDNVSLNADISWNNINYKGTRIIDDGNGSTESFRSRLDTWSLRFGGDVYFGDANIAPFVNANVGWNFIDTNIADGPPGSICWWDPWWGYICQGYQNTYKEDNFNYGLGAGVRMEVGRTNFIKLGYYTQWMDFDTASGSPAMDSIRLEYGFSF